MKVLLATSEVVPFSKTGGLADVCGALPVALEKLGHEMVVFAPAHRRSLTCGQPIETTDVKFELPIGGRIVEGGLLKGQLPNSSVPVYLVDQPGFFDRAELYRERGEDYKDNCERFVFFCRAVMESIRLLELDVQVLHCNDWQTGLIPAYLRLEYQHARGYEDLVTIQTIHNMSYQGVFWHWDMLLTGLDWKYFNWRQMEFWGNLNLLKTGLAFTDAITTVSPKYAEDIQSAPLGCGLEGVLQQRRQVLTGIVNGVDYIEWNPATDHYLPVRYSVADWTTGKASCKAALQAELSLPQSPRTPLIGLIGRLADQKGWDLVIELMRTWVRNEDAQWVVLGTGEPKYHEQLAALASEYPNRIAVRLEFSDRWAHRIEAASDVFLMPSRFEPCGLNQMYSLKYGSVPVVRATGGLADTITDVSAETLASRTANGFSFEPYDVPSLEATLRRAFGVLANQPDVWRQIVETGMRQDWSWDRSAAAYAQLYERTRQRRQAARPELAMAK